LNRIAEKRVELLGADVPSASRRSLARVVLEQDRGERLRRRTGHDCAPRAGS
jgi:hypothetical protein